MKKLFTLILTFILSLSIYATVNVRGLNEYLMLEKGYKNSWSDNRLTADMVGEGNKYIGSWTILYTKKVNGIDKTLLVMYTPANKGPKGHWQGEPLEVSITCSSLNKKTSYSQLDDLIDAFTRYNSNKKQNQKLRQARKELKLNQKNGILVSTVGNTRTIVVNF